MTAQQPAQGADTRMRQASGEEADRLTDLSMRSKAYWGYEPAFIAACAEELRIDAAAIDDPVQVWRVAEKAAGIAGVYGLVPVDAEVVELEALFIEPELIGSGLGRRLIDDAVSRARSRGFRRMIIQGDPNAEGFYLAIGASRSGERESASIPGRFLPMFTIDLVARTAPRTKPARDPS